MDTDKKLYEWYAVPPYNNEGWQIKNEEGGHVATFEDKRECLETVRTIQKSKNIRETGVFRVEQKLAGTGTFDFLTEHKTYEEAKDHYEHALDVGFREDEIRLVEVIL